MIDIIIEKIKKLISKFNILKLKLDYSMAALKNRYPCKLVGEKHLLEANSTIILYTVLGKSSTVYEIPIRDLLNDADLVARFHPSQAVKLGVIALGDILLMTPEDQRIEKYKQIINQMMDNPK